MRWTKATRDHAAVLLDGLRDSAACETAQLDNRSRFAHTAAPMPHESLLEQYDRLLPALQTRGEDLRREIEAWLASEPNLKVHSVTVRVKSRESLAGKLARPDRTYRDLWDVTDLVGLRVITYFEDAVDQVGQLVEARLPIDFEHSIDKRSRRDAAAFGYRSLHYVCRMNASGVSLPPSACCELQVRTVLEHAWAEIEHDLGYKAQEAVPIAARRRLHRIAGLLELADQEFGAIRRDLEEYARTLPKRIEAKEEAVPLDQLALVPLLDCEEVSALDKEIAQALHRDLGDEPFFPEYLLKMLASSGILTVAAAREGIREHAPAILAMVKPYFAFAWRTWSLSPDQMPHIYRGYSLFFLAHIQVLRASVLGIDKVAQLTRLYRELDYPDDERAAHRVASMLIDAFGESNAN